MLIVCAWLVVVVVVVLLLLLLLALTMTSMMMVALAAVTRIKPVCKSCVKLCKSAALFFSAPLFVQLLLGQCHPKTRIYCCCGCCDCSCGCCCCCCCCWFCWCQ